MTTAIVRPTRIAATNPPAASTNVIRVASKIDEKLSLAAVHTSCGGGKRKLRSP